MIDWVNGKVAELILLVRGGAVLMAVVMVAYAYAKTRSFVVLLGAALTAGFFLWTINNVDWWQQRISEETRGAVVVVTVPPGEVAVPAAPGLAVGEWVGV